MRTLQYIMLTTLLICFTGSCYFGNLESVSGNGKVIQQDRNVSGISGIKVATGIDAIITQGDAESLTVKADENLMDYIKTEVVDGILKIYTEKNIRHAKEKKVYLTYKKLNSIDISSAGDVQGNNTLVTDNLDIEMSSAGDLDLAVQADKVEITISSAGDASLSGKTNYFKADLSSAGDLKAFDLETKSADVSVSSAGTANIFVTDEADFRCTSAGNINYKGEPRIKNISTSSAGSVNKK